MCQRAEDNEPLSRAVVPVYRCGYSATLDIRALVDYTHAKKATELAFFKFQRVMYTRRIIPEVGGERKQFVRPFYMKTSVSLLL